MESLPITTAEAGMIKNMLIRNTHKQIAELLGRSVQEIATEAAKYAVTGVVTMEEKRPVKIAKIKAPKVAKPSNSIKEKKIAEFKKEERKRNEQERMKILQQQKRDRENSRRKVNSRVVDYSTQVTVRIDAKTMIYCKPGEEKMAKEKFLRLHRPNEISNLN